jgi:hypothetical protein
MGWQPLVRGDAPGQWGIQHQGAAAHQDVCCCGASVPTRMRGKGLSWCRRGYPAEELTCAVLRARPHASLCSQSLCCKSFFGAVHHTDTSRLGWC